MARWQDYPLVGGSYSDESRPFSVQETINYIPVKAEAPGTRSPAKLRCAPGFSLIYDLGTKPVRGMHNAEGVMLVVAGTTLFQLNTDGSSTDLGKIPGTARVSMAHNSITNGNQIAIANGISGYVYDTTTGILQQITDDGFYGSKYFDFVDQYIVGVTPDGTTAFTSELNDALSYNTLDEYQAEGSPDKLISCIVTHREWWLMGARTIEPYGDTGDNTGTFARQSGIVIERGLAATFAQALLDNSVFWLGDDGVVYRANGYTPVRISTLPIEHAIAGFNLANAFAFTFEDQGHKIFYLTFPDGYTFGYDVASKEWHRRESYGLNRWRINALAKWNNMWLGGDYANGKVYKLDWGLASEDGQILERRRIGGVTADSQNRIIVNAFEIVVDTGLPQKQPAAITPVLTIKGDIPDGIVGNEVDYRYVVKATYQTVTVVVESGALPTGLTMSDIGVVTGKVTVPGTYNWTVKATDAKGSTVSVTDTATFTNVLDPAQTWKYLIVENSDITDYSDPAFDDSGWASGPAPFGDISNDASVGTAAQTYNPQFATGIGTTATLGKTVWMRRTFDMTTIPDSVEMVGYFAGAYTLYLNGEILSSSGIVKDGVTVEFDTDKFIVGTNYLALRGEDLGTETPDATYFDMFLQASS